MIQLRLKFSTNDGPTQEFEIVDGELLSDAIKRALDGVPLGQFEVGSTFNTTVNGLAITEDFWSFTKLKSTDTVIISPKIKDGESGQIFKQIGIIAITAIATYFLGPAGYGLTGSALAAAGAAVTIGASLLMNALIPPPIPKSADLSQQGGVESSQMYAISGQSNEVKRFETVPKVYGMHRIFPSIAATPYTELAVETASTNALRRVQDLTYTAVAVGSQGNSITIEYTNTALTPGSETISVDGKAIKIGICSGQSTATQIRNAFNGNAAATALATCSITGNASTPQTSQGVITLANGTGQIVQYLYAVYDFGMGNVQVADLKIGDTPLTTDSFGDFEYNFVDPNRPETPEDDYDKLFAREFKYYKGQREVSPLSVALLDGHSEVQNASPNSHNYNQEIVLDLVADRGLYGFSSDGALGERNVRLEVYFAKVGTDDWKAYNDLSAVDRYNVTGGTDVTDFETPFAPTITTPTSDQYYNAWYAQAGYYTGTLNGKNISQLNFTLNSNSSKILVPARPDYLVGSKIFVLGDWIGNITGVSVHPTDSSLMIIQLDRQLDHNWAEGHDFQFLYQPIYKMQGHAVARDTSQPYGAQYVYDVGPYDIVKFRTSRHEQGIAVVQGTSTNAVYASIRFTPKETGEYKVRIKRVNAYGTYGTSVGDDLTWIGITTAFQNNPILTDKRHTFMELKIRATDQLNGNINTLSGVATSLLPIYDSDTQTWRRDLTSNPAWVFCDLMTGQVNKRAISRDKLHLDSIVEWAEYCDETPTPPPGYDYVTPRFSCNFVLDYSTTLQELLAQIGGASQASLNIIDGKYGILIDRFRNTPVQIFTPRNSKDFSSVRNYGPRPEGLHVKFIDPDSDWEVRDVTVFDNGFDDSNAEDYDDLTAFACTNPEQAWRFGRYMLAQNRLRQETITLTVDFEYLVCTRGDYVQITQDVMKVGGTPARVKTMVGNVATIDDAIDFDPDITYGYTFRSAEGEMLTSTCTVLAPDQFQLDGDLPEEGDLFVIGEVGQITFDCIVKAISPNDDLSATLTLVEKADGIYDAEGTGAIPDYNPFISDTSHPAKPPRAVENFVIADMLYECAATKSGYAYYVDLSWDMPIGSVFETFEVYANDGRGFRLYDSTKNKLFRYQVEQDRLGIAHEFKVAAVSATGNKLQLIAMPTVGDTPLAKTTPPSDVTNFSANITNQVLQLNWDEIPDCDVFQYVIRFSPDNNDVWESSVPLQTVSKNVTSISVQARTGVYFIKAIDYAGNQSAIATAIITTIPGLIDLNVIDEINEAPLFQGVLDQTEKLGEAVVLREQVPGDVNSVQYFTEGFYEFADLLDVGDIYSVRLQSLLRADGLKKGELMSDWAHLSDIDHLNTALHSDWNVSLQYRATEAFAAMSDWDHLYNIDHINFGAGTGFTDWRDIPTTGDATARIFQFRARLQSLTPNVTPRLFDTTVSADMPDRQDSFENLISSASDLTVVTYETVFKGPGNSPNVQITMDNGQTGDYWQFENKTLEGFGIRFYDKNGVQVSRQFDVVAKGYGRRHTATI